MPCARITRFIHELMEEIEEIESNDIYGFLAENKSIITQQLDVIYKINADVRLLAGKFTETYRIQLHGNSMNNVKYEKYDKLTRLRESYKLLNTHLNYKQGFFTCCSNYLNNSSLNLQRNALRSISILVGGVSHSLSLDKLEEYFLDYLGNDETYTFVEQFKADLANF